MSGDIDISISSGGVTCVTVPLTTTDVVPFQGSGTLYGWSLREASGEIPSDVRASVVAPAALATIVASVALPAGVYDVQWSVELTGPAAVGDGNNFQLVNGVTVVAGSVNAPVAGVYPQPNERMSIAQGTTVSIQAIGAGTAGVTYTGDLSVTPDPFFGVSVELQAGGDILGESSMDLQDSDTQWFGDRGIRLDQFVRIHVIAGTVTGTLYIDPS